MRTFLFITLYILINNRNSVLAQPVLSLTPVIAGLSSPMEFVHAGDGSNRIFIVQKGGSILVYNKAFALLDTFLNITTGLTSDGERGLLSLAFHPNYASNGLFFIYYTKRIR
jgi:hypothetical protein